VIDSIQTALPEPAAPLDDALEQIQTGLDGVLGGLLGGLGGLGGLAG